ncbi:MAG: LTA synthase family protein [Lachnospiraceae bacterium]|nr:LTA synthase family protein [Lachnospiraceae bacterium]
MFRVIVTSFIVPIFVDSIASGRFTVLPRKKRTYLYNVVAVMLLYTLLNIFFWQYQINFLILITLYFIIAIAMYYVHEFRGTNINMSDILSINTAKEVASGYKYEVTPTMLVSFIIIVLEYIVQIFYYKIDLLENYNKGINGFYTANIGKYNVFLYEIKEILIFIFLFSLLRDIVSKNKYDYSIMAGNNEGYLYNFYSSIPFFHKNNKENKLYDDNLSIDITKDDLTSLKNKVSFNKLDTKNAQSIDKFISESKKPHVIVIMNESFGSVNRRIKTNVKVTNYYDNLKGVIKGDLYVNTFGGGTANTEFEFLTGVSIGNYPYPVMPYNNFVKKDKYSLAHYFKKLGYKTFAMHPYTATNYNRDKVYKRFGFDELLFFDDFQNKKYVRSFVSDASMYEEIIRRYESVKNNNETAFIFGITMQNHSGYSKFDGQEVVSYIDNINAYEKESLDSYLSLMKISDDSIRLLINYFEKEKDNVVLLFFGDHNASFGSSINSLVYDTNFNYECSNAYVTPFFIYNNFEKNNRAIEGISANFLSLELLKSAHLPFDDVHILMDSIYKEYSVYNFHKRKKVNDGELCDINFDRLMEFEEEYLK